MPSSASVEHLIERAVDAAQSAEVHADSGRAEEGAVYAECAKAYALAAQAAATVCAGRIAAGKAP